MDLAPGSTKLCCKGSYEHWQFLMRLDLVLAVSPNTSLVKSMAAELFVDDHLASSS